MAAIDKRRPVAAREYRWVGLLVEWLVAWGIRPNAISISSLLFSSLAAASLYLASSHDGIFASLLWIFAAMMVLLRLLTNMLDGMVAVASGTQSRLGDLFNELPDRLSDSLILMVMGVAVDVGMTVGFLATVSTIMAAYVRLLGNQLGVYNLFCGPMAKQQRMTVVIVLCVARALLPVATGESLWLAGLWVILVGTVFTAGRRVYRILQEVAA